MLGFGPMGYRAINELMPHNMYGQVMAELGIVGAVAFGLILLGVAQNSLEAWRIVREMAPTDNRFPLHSVLVTATAILLLMIMGWGFNFLYWHVWLWFGGFQVVAMDCLKRQAESGQLSEEVLMEPGPQNVEKP